MATETTEQTQRSLRDWVAANSDMLWDSVRIFLGFALVVKGFAYLFQHAALTEIMVQSGVPFASRGLAEAISLVHITGGLMMTFGVFTRLGAAIQIPNLIGAVLFVHLKEGLFTEGQTLEFTVLVLFLLCLIAVVGAGRLSIDWAFAEKRMRMHEELAPSP
jgi:putative oxidoreductase